MKVLSLLGVVFLLSLTTACGGSSASTSQVAGRLVMVVHASNPVSSISAGQVSSLFLGQQRYWEGGVAVKPVLLPTSAPASQDFYAGILGMTSSQFQRKWSSKQLSGAGFAPKTAGSPQEMLRDIATSQGGIGYMLAEDFEKASPKGVKSVPIVQ